MTWWASGPRGVAKGVRVRGSGKGHVAALGRASWPGGTDSAALAPRGTITATWQHEGRLAPWGAVENASRHGGNGFGRVSAVGTSIVPFLVLWRIDGQFC